jgi:hypothetical protein
MFVIVPFLNVRFNDHSAREILYAGSWANKLIFIRAANRITDKRDLVFIFICFKNIFPKLMKRIEELTQRSTDLPAGRQGRHKDTQRKNVMIILK